MQTGVEWCCSAPGLALIYVGLDQGNRLDRFQSGTVTCLIVGGAALVVGFLINEAVVADPWASPKVLMSRNIILVLMALITFMITSLSNNHAGAELPDHRRSVPT